LGTLSSAIIGLPLGLVLDRVTGRDGRITGRDGRIDLIY
jgi:hypothetical protein